LILEINFNDQTLLAQGNSSYGFIDSTPSKLNLINPFSYVVFRFERDNPGIWMLHCHNDGFSLY